MCHQKLNGNQENRKTKTLGKPQRLLETLLSSPAAPPTYRPQEALGLLDGSIAPQEAHKHHHSSHSNENVDAWGEKDLSEQTACIIARDRNTRLTPTTGRVWQCELFGPQCPAGGAATATRGQKSNSVPRECVRTSQVCSAL